MSDASKTADEEDHEETADDVTATDDVQQLLEEALEAVRDDDAEE
ncbi:hypothetical protein [Halorubrum sp. N11]